MTNQDKIKWLKQYKHLDSSIKRLIDEKERYKSIALKVTPTWSDMPKGSDGENPRELAICKMMDCESEINAAIDDYVDLGRQIKSSIELITDSELRLLLLYRYIDCKTWENISVNMHYDVEGKNVYKLHGKAISLLDE